MIFLTFAAADGPHLGMLTGETVLDLTEAWPSGAGVPAPRHVGDLAAAQEAGLVIVRKLQSDASPSKKRLPLSSLSLMAPIPRPAKNIFCVGRNYKDHIDEGMRAQGKEPAPLPSVPEFFTKPPTAVIPTNSTIPLHAGVTDKLDYEAELALIIGRPGSNIPAAKAFEHVFGYSIVNDITGRELQRRYGQWFKGKGLDRLMPVRAGRGACARPDQCCRSQNQHGGQWRDPSGQPHQPDDFPDPGDHRASLARPDVRGRRCDRDRNAFRRRLRDDAAAFFWPMAIASQPGSRASACWKIPSSGSFGRMADVTRHFMVETGRKARLSPREPTHLQYYNTICYFGAGVYLAARTPSAGGFLRNQSPPRCD